LKAVVTKRSLNIFRDVELVNRHDPAMFLGRPENFS